MPGCLWAVALLAAALAATASAADKTVLYASGGFLSVGGVAADNVVAWNGSHWSALGAGLTLTSQAIRVYAVTQAWSSIYVGGGFQYPVAGLARWDGVSWTMVGGGISPGGSVWVFLNYQDGFLAGGLFYAAGEVPAASIAHWNGRAWSALGAGFSGVVTTLCVQNGLLYAGGDFAVSPSGAVFNGVAAWDGQAWTALQSGLNWNYYNNPYSAGVVYALLPYKGDLIVGGTFTGAGTVPLRYVGRWNGTAWSALGVTDDGLEYAVIDMTLGLDGVLTVGGYVHWSRSTALGRVAKWTGTTWVDFSGGSGVMGDHVGTFAVAFGSLFVGGDIISAGSASTTGVARWNGASWSSIGSFNNGDFAPIVDFLLAGCQLGWTGPACSVCDFGSYGTNCARCQIGTYADAVGREACTLCPPNAVTLSTGSYHIQQCLCKAGCYGPAGGPCIGSQLYRAHGGVLETSRARWLTPPLAR